MTYKIATVKESGSVLRITFEGDKKLHKAWLNAPFAKDLVVGAEAEATFKVVANTNPQYQDDTFIESWGGVAAGQQKKGFGGGKAWSPKPEYETLAPLAQAAIKAAVDLVGPDGTIEQQSRIIQTANTFFDAMIAMCQRGKGKLEPRSAASAPSGPNAQRPTPNAPSGNAPTPQSPNASPSPKEKEKPAPVTVPSPNGKSAFGYKPERWPIEQVLCDPPTEKQREGLLALAKEHNIAEEALEPMRRLIARAYGIPATPSKGSLMLFGDFLRNAGPEAIDQAATLAMDPAEEFSEDHGDPAVLQDPDDPRAAYLWLADKLGWPGHGDGPQCATAFMATLGRRAINADELTADDWLKLYRFAALVSADPRHEPRAFQHYKEQRAKERSGVGV